MKQIWDWNIWAVSDLVWDVSSDCRECRLQDWKLWQEPAVLGRARELARRWSFCSAPPHRMGRCWWEEQEFLGYVFPTVITWPSISLEWATLKLCCTQNRKLEWDPGRLTPTLQTDTHAAESPAKKWVCWLPGHQTTRLYAQPTAEG